MGTLNVDLQCLCTAFCFRLQWTRQFVNHPFPWSVSKRLVNGKTWKVVHAMVALVPPKRLRPCATLMCQFSRQIWDFIPLHGTVFDLRDKWHRSQMNKVCIGDWSGTERAEKWKTSSWGQISSSNPTGKGEKVNDVRLFPVLYLVIVSIELFKLSSKIIPDALTCVWNDTMWTSDNFLSFIPVFSCSACNQSSHQSPGQWDLEAAPCCLLLQTAFWSIAPLQNCNFHPIMSVWRSEMSCSMFRVRFVSKSLVWHEPQSWFCTEYVIFLSLSLSVFIAWSLVLTFF